MWTQEEKDDNILSSPSFVNHESDNEEEEDVKETTRSSITSPGAYIRVTNNRPVRDLHFSLSLFISYHTI